MFCDEQTQKKGNLEGRNMSPTQNGPGFLWELKPYIIAILTNTTGRGVKMGRILCLLHEFTCISKAFIRKNNNLKT
jgi:hypothetical protein